MTDGMTAEQLGQKYADATRGLMVRTENLETGERGAVYLPPDGDYVVLVGPQYECATNVWPNTGTTQLTIKRRDDSDV